MRRSSRGEERSAQRSNRSSESIAATNARSESEGPVAALSRMARLPPPPPFLETRAVLRRQFCADELDRRILQGAAFRIGRGEIRQLRGADLAQHGNRLRVDCIEGGALRAGEVAQAAGLAALPEMPVACVFPVALAAPADRMRQGEHLGAARHQAGIDGEGCWFWHGGLRVHPPLEGEGRSKAPGWGDRARRSGFHPHPRVPRDLPPQGGGGKVPHRHTPSLTRDLSPWCELSSGDPRA
ncbi:hypothetical protein FDR95_28700 [Rhizobiaceae bacterium LC148]|nr:hypothetical protein FDR95_28700 [Rhizobiaceae bacterium LC148]